MDSSSTTNDPHTPTYTDLTPHLSSASPDTPKKEDQAYTPTIIQTPTRMGYNGIGVGVRPNPDPSPSKTPKPVKPTEQAVAQKEVEGLGYEIELDDGTIDVGAEMIGEGSNSSSRDIVLDASDLASLEMMGEPSEKEVDVEVEDRDIEFPSFKEMKTYTDRLTGAGDLETKDLVDMVKSLLDPCLSHLPNLYGQLEAQKATIQTLQHQAKLSKQLTDLERDRHSAERKGWHREMKALVSSRDREIAAGKRPRKGLDLNVGYHQELEASNKRLEMDNRLMAPRLADTQRQIDKLVNELRHLRSNVIMSTSAIDSTPGPSRHTHAGRRKSVSPTRAIFNATTMGDARSEHILLAARKVRSMRQGNHNVGMLTLQELQRSGVVGPEGGLGYSEGYGDVMEDSDEESDTFEEGEEEIEDRKPVIDHGRKGSKGRASVNNTPSFPKTKKGTKQNLPAPPTTPRSRKTQGPPPTTTPGGSNFSDLLRAAELATRPTTPKGEGRVPIPMSAMSATRTRMREESSERGSPVKKARRVEEEDQEGADSALDLLAQASQLEVAQGETPPAEPIQFPTPTQTQQSTRPPSSTGSFLEPPIDLHPTPPSHSHSQSQSQGQDQNESGLVLSTEPTTMKTPSTRPRNLSISQLSELQTPRGNYEVQHPGHATDPPAHMQYQSPQGNGGVPGLGKYVHLSSSMPARRVRSPYLKWTIEEDELLARAVAIHGEKWDLVSKGVPTRSYHQVRQRWLRKTGAFDKKQSQTPGDHHGSSNLGLGFGLPLPIGMGMGMDEDREGSPTPQSGRGKRRRGSEE